MQVLCEKSNTGSDVRCAVCGQGFLLYWERSIGTSRAEKEDAKREVVAALRGQHEDVTTGHHAHESVRFTVPVWTGAPRIPAMGMIPAFAL